MQEFANETDTMEFNIVCDGVSFSFTIKTADDSDSELLEEIAVIGLTCSDEDFQTNFELLFNDNEQLQIIKDVMISQILAIRNNLDSQNCYNPQTQKENTMPDQNQNPAAETIAETTTSSPVNQPENESTMNNAAETIKNTAEQTAEAVKSAADNAKVTVEKAAEATQGFAARHKKKLIIGGALVAGVTAGFFGWKYRMNIPFLGKAAEAATEATTA